MGEREAGRGTVRGKGRREGVKDGTERGKGRRKELEIRCEWFFKDRINIVTGEKKCISLVRSIKLTSKMTIKR